MLRYLLLPLGSTTHLFDKYEDLRGPVDVMMEALLTSFISSYQTTSTIPGINQGTNFSSRQVDGSLFDSRSLCGVSV